MLAGRDVFGKEDEDTWNRNRTGRAEERGIAAGSFCLSTVRRIPLTVLVIPSGCRGLWAGTIGDSTNQRRREKQLRSRMSKRVYLFAFNEARR